MHALGRTDTSVDRPQLSKQCKIKGLKQYK